MPAKKTFNSIRVRGPARFDSMPTVEGVPLSELLGGEVSGEGGVKRFVALLSQSGANAPVAIVLENTLGGDPQFVRDEEGAYGMLLAGAFPIDKTLIFSAQSGGDSWSAGAFGDGIFINVPGDGRLDHRPLMVLVYP